MFDRVFASILFHELCCRYSLDNLKFGKMDVSRYPDMATKYVECSAVFQFAKFKFSIQQCCLNICLEAQIIFNSRDS